MHIGIHLRLAQQKKSGSQSQEGAFGGRGLTFPRPSLAVTIVPETHTGAAVLVSATMVGELRSLRRVRWRLFLASVLLVARAAADTAYSYIKLEGVIPQGTVVATKVVPTRLGCSAVCVSVGCQAYTLEELPEEGLLCTALSPVYELTYVPLNSDLRVYSTQERLSALTTTTTPPPTCLDDFIASCYHILDGPSGSLVVTSATYYTNSQNCAWRVVVAAGFRVQLTWDSFSLESCCDSAFVADPCDGGTAYTWTKHTGSSIPPSTTSKGNEMVIKFQSDGSVIYPGFTLQYVAV
ncbi:putative cubilin-like [Penaeus vannamei]|uniref:Putative cubilin-like n=1 Tax=Penaeus vannamei TaxID=6689 RepID=A0A423STU1_PENVA|nr:putative cubilin-like [Penaeus vannamei]